MLSDRSSGFTGLIPLVSGVTGPVPIILRLMSSMLPRYIELLKSRVYVFLHPTVFFLSLH